MEPSTILILVLTAALAFMAIVCRSNFKRINQLERDVTYLMAGSKGTVSYDFSNKGDGKVHRNTPEALAAAPQIADAGHMLREAGVTEKKAYRAAELAIKYGWQLLDIQENIKMVRYMRANNGDVTKVNVYHGGKGGKRDLFTVATALNHPSKGKTQLFRKHITEHELEAILKNPRTHTEKGYYKR